MNFYLVRHGESVGNSKKYYCGVTDVPLTDNGRKQAEAMSGFFRDKYVDKVYSSPLTRAYNTARYISQKVDKEIIVDDLLIERDFGIFEKLTWDDIQKLYPSEVKKWIEEGLDYRFVGGENIPDVINRVKLFMDKNDCNNSVIIAHGAVIMAFLLALGCVTYENVWDFHIKNSTIVNITNDDVNDLYKFKLINV